MIDNQEIGEQHQELILYWLNRFSWLTSRQLAKLIWREHLEGLSLARRCLAKMIEKKLVIRRPLPNGAEAYLVGAKGASKLMSLWNIQGESGARVKLGNPVHRACSNWYLIDEIIENKTPVATEHEIQSGKGPVRQILGKVPDGLCFHTSGAEWIEVENSWKNRAEREKIVRFCAEMLGHEKMEPLSVDYDLARVVMVAATHDAGNALIRSFIEAFESGYISKAALQEIDIAFVETSHSLMPPLQIGKVNLWESVFEPRYGSND